MSLNGLIGKASIPLLCAILGGTAYAVFGLTYKLAANTKCRIPAFIFLMTSIAGICSFITAFQSPVCFQDWRLWAMGIGGGVLVFFAMYLVSFANTIGPSSIAWTAAGLSLLFPIGIFAIFFHESVYPLDFFILFLFSAMIFFFARGLKSSEDVHKGKGLILGLAISGVFFINGGWMALNKAKEIVFSSAYSSEYATMNYGAAAVLALCWHIRQEGLHLFKRNEWLVGGVGGVLSVTGTLLFLKALVLPSTVVFSLVNGISLMGGTILAIIFFKEKINVAKIVGLVLGLTVLLLAVSREVLSGWLFGKG